MKFPLLYVTQLFSLKHSTVSERGIIVGGNLLHISLFDTGGGEVMPAA